MTARILLLAEQTVCLSNDARAYGVKENDGCESTIYSEGRYDGKSCFSHVSHRNGTWGLRVTFG